MTDTERIDSLERFVAENKALTLHDGSVDLHGHLGLSIGWRTLREAIDYLDHWERVDKRQ